MDLPISLQRVVAEMDCLEGTTVYLNKRTGELLLLFDDSSRFDSELENDAERLEADEDFLPLPDKQEIDEWGMMVSFAQSRDEEQVTRELLDAVQGRGAFRMFRSTVTRHGLLDEWYAFRDASYEEIAVDWLEAHGVPFVREASPEPSPASDE